MYHFSEVCQEMEGAEVMYKKFALLLEKNQITAYRVSKESGIAQSTFSDWKNGKSNPKIDKLIKLAKYFDVPIDYFLSDEMIDV